ncbi:MAG: hypothetical protein GSR80_000879 [Desulfurococcales archaeon]|nr:hypothetical protein [Desulfurococcales archaeon]
MTPQGGPGCPSGLARPRTRPSAPRVRVTLTPSTRGARASYTRGPRGPRLAVHGPLEWLQEPPSVGELARLLCCAQDDTLDSILGTLGGVLSAAAVALSLVPATSPGTLAAVAFFLVIAGIPLWLIGLARAARGRRLEECLSRIQPTAVERVTLEPLARAILEVLRAARACGGGSCVADTPLGRYRLRLRRGLGSRLIIRASPTGS